MLGLTLVVASLIAMGHFTDFMLGDRGQRLVKDNLVDLYIAVSAEDWRSYFAKASMSYERFLWSTFAMHSPKLYALRVLMYSATFFVAVTLTYLGWRKVSFGVEYDIQDITIYGIECLGLFVVTYLTDLATIRLTAFSLATICRGHRN